MYQKNLFNIKPTWTSRRMNQGDCRQYPDDINLDRLPRFELKVIEIFILFSLVNI